ncbi:hypothetical protein PG993_014949 [Apiospora rasikravindrae]|uniref:Uncharacterized protein n=1 Tax=Apiospora rasikravindrae TaxID=990691 RepID=A0ABR1RQN5_9PEZI
MQLSNLLNLALLASTASAGGGWAWGPWKYARDDLIRRRIPHHDLEAQEVRDIPGDVSAEAKALDLDDHGRGTAAREYVLEQQDEEEAVSILHRPRQGLRHRLVDSREVLDVRQQQHREGGAEHQHHHGHSLCHRAVVGTARYHHHHHHDGRHVGPDVDVTGSVRGTQQHHGRVVLIVCCRAGGDHVGRNASAGGDAYDDDDDNDGAADYAVGDGLDGAYYGHEASHDDYHGASDPGGFDIDFDDDGIGGGTE